MRRQILAAIVTEETQLSGGVPIFLAKDEAEQKQLAQDLGRLFQADVHRISNGIHLIMTAEDKNLY